MRRIDIGSLSSHSSATNDGYREQRNLLQGEFSSWRISVVIFMRKTHLAGFLMEIENRELSSTTLVLNESLLSDLSQVKFADECSASG